MLNKRFKYLRLIILVVAVFVLGYNYSSLKTLDNQRKDLLEKRDELILKMAHQGDYRCCINPPCTMCFMGSWIWDDGTCKCDDMIAAGEFDKVCPQCQRGVKEGQCASTEQAFCDTENFKEVKE
ncbi:MAG: hypothetical protein MAG795_01185 [Candidatus Woesearchaeota archaeon]|nr:hypothetical protein [Candidatus Woesearchaeota archaeon]